MQVDSSALPRLPARALCSRCTVGRSPMPLACPSPPPALTNPPCLPPPPPALLQERLYDQSDAYRVHVCSTCGLVAVANLKKNQFYCTACKNTTGIVQVGCVCVWAAAAVRKGGCGCLASRCAARAFWALLPGCAAGEGQCSCRNLMPLSFPPCPQVFIPYACKLLFQELMAMCIGECVCVVGEVQACRQGACGALCACIFAIQQGPKHGMRLAAPPCSNASCRFPALSVCSAPHGGGMMARLQHWRRAVATPHAAPLEGLFNIPLCSCLCSALPSCLPAASCSLLSLFPITASQHDFVTVDPGVRREEERCPNAVCCWLEERCPPLPKLFVSGGSFFTGQFYRQGHSLAGFSSTWPSATA